MNLSKKLPNKKLLTYVEKRIKRIEDLGFKVTLVDVPRILEDGRHYGGWFSEDLKELKVAVGQKWEKWFPIFVHETCHFDQWLEKCLEWKIVQNVYRKQSAHEVFFNWLQKKKYSDDVVFRAIEAVRTNELDCERRVAKELINNNLNALIDVSIINKQANAYIYFYNVMYFTRKWYHKDFRPYKVKKLWNMMPDHFNNDYTQLPIDYYRQCVKHCYKKK